MKSGTVHWLVVLGAALIPMLALAQCMPAMMAGSHGQGHGMPSQAVASTDETIRDLLSDEQSRTALLAAVLSDARFMRAVVDRAAAAPKWRALMRERLAARSAPADSVAPDSIPEGGGSVTHQHQGH